MSLTDQLLLIISEGTLTFGLIRETLSMVTGYDNRKAVWSTLERLHKKGFVKKGKNKEGIQFSLTAEGQKALPIDATYIRRPDRAWDKKWRLVIFDIPKNKRNAKDTFLLKIKEMGFARICSSTYITVHDVTGQVRKLASSLYIDAYVKVMLVEDIGIKDMKKTAEKIWDIDKLNKNYQSFMKKYKNGYQGREFSSLILRFWLKKARYEYLNILHKDPVLPKELLPFSWEGQKAQKIYEQLEKILGTY